MEILAIDRTFIEGFGALIAGLVLFVGSVYLLLAAIFGLRMGYLVVATGFFAFWVILASLWAFGAPGTLRFLGPKGDLPSWQVLAAGQDLESPTFPVISRYPGEPWKEPDKGQSGEVEPVSLAAQEFLAEEASGELHSEAIEGEITPEDFEVTNVRFTTAGESELAAATAFATTGGREVTVVAIRDEGSEPVPSYIALGLGILGFAIHLPFLDRAERKRKDVLTGGEQGPWRGPA